MHNTGNPKSNGHDNREQFDQTERGKTATSTMTKAESDAYNKGYNNGREDERKDRSNN